MSKKEEFIGLRISRELKATLEKKAKEKGVSLSRLVEEELHDSYKTDKDQILSLIDKRKDERPIYWKELEKSPIVREFEDCIGTLYTEFINPISRDTKYQPVVLLAWTSLLLNATIKHFDSIPEEHKGMAAFSLIKVGTTLIDGLTNIKSNDKETQEEIIKLKKDFVEKASYHFTALAFAKESYNHIREELEKVANELIKELKEKSEVQKEVG